MPRQVPSPKSQVSIFSVSVVHKVVPGSYRTVHYAKTTREITRAIMTGFQARWQKPGGRKESLVVHSQARLHSRILLMPAWLPCATQAQVSLGGGMLD